MDDVPLHADSRRLRLPSDLEAEGDGVLQAPSMPPPGMHSIQVAIYIHMCVKIQTYIYIYIYIDR
jgi:hypothetical protein